MASAKLIYILGTMGSAKTANALMVRFDFLRHDKNVLFLKSSLDTRDGVNIIKSRVPGMEAPVNEFNPDDNIIQLFNKELETVDRIIVDEVELATAEQVEQLKQIVVYKNVPVYAYGLRTNFKSFAFEGSKRMFELCDDIRMLENICPCGELATQNARYDSETGKIAYDGPEIVIGGDEKYIGLCYKCWKEGIVKPKIKTLK